MFNEQTLNKQKQESLFEVLEAKNTRASSALFAYARYLNQIPLQYGYFPLYMKIFEANNQYAVDALIEGFEPERFLDFIVVPNPYVLRAIFKTMDTHRPNTLYEKTVRAFCGIIKRVYHNMEDGSLKICISQKPRRRNQLTFPGIIPQNIMYIGGSMRVCINCQETDSSGENEHVLHFR